MLTQAPVTLCFSCLCGCAFGWLRIPTNWLRINHKWNQTTTTAAYIQKVLRIGRKTMLCARLNLLCVFFLSSSLFLFVFVFLFRIPFKIQIGRFCFHNKYNKNSVELVVQRIIIRRCTSITLVRRNFSTCASI